MDMKKVAKYALRIICLGLVLWAVMYSGFSFQDEDIIKYEGEKYTPIQFSQDIFMYYCSEEVSFEEGEIQRVKGSDYDMIILCEGDIYCNKDQVDDASGYYADDNNYEWYAVVETDDDVIEYAIDVTVDDMAFFNSVENLPKEKAIFFEEISEKIGDAPRFFIYQYIWFS